MTHRTRIKLCGLTRLEDVGQAVALGADAIGLVFYAPSPRYVAPETAARLAESVPPMVSTVGLFVNADLDEVTEVLRRVPLSLLQFHGDETPAQCREIAEAVRRPFMRALRIRPDTTAADLLESQAAYRTASPLFSGLAARYLERCVRWHWKGI
jgi:phosphoribosylanthranilate isomerase